MGGFRDPWESAREILCVRLDSLGDVLMTTPAFRALKQSCPGRRLVLLTSPAGAEAGRLIPEIDEVLVYEAPWVKSTPVRADAAGDRDVVEALRARRFDAAVIFTVYSQNPLPAALLCTLADIPLRLAYCRENPYQLLSDWLPEAEPQLRIRHEVRRQLELVARTGASVDDERLSLSVSGAVQQRVSHLLFNLGVDLGRRWVAIHPGATAASRRYPPEKFAEVARELRLRHGEQILFTGSDSEAGLIDGIQCAIGADSFSLAGLLNLEELGALLHQSALLISNNTGTVHVAAAMGTPVVDVYALTNPQHTPWGVPTRVLSHDVPCKYCYKSVCPEGHHDCLRRVEPEDVVRAALELIGGNSCTRSESTPPFMIPQPAWSAMAK